MEPTRGTAPVQEHNESVVVSKQQKMEIASRETKVLIWLRASFFVTLLALGIAVSISTYATSREAQTSAFSKRFETYSSRIIDSFVKVVERQLAVADGLSIALTSESLRQVDGRVFPFISLPDFVMRGSAARVMGETPLILWAPLVEEHQRAAWESFVESTFPAHFSFSLEQEKRQQEIQDIRYGYSSNVTERFDLKLQRPSFQIRQYHPDGAVPASNNSGPYLPSFDTSSKRPSFAGFNINLLSHPATDSSLRAMLDSGLAVIGETSHLNFVSGCATGVVNSSIIIISFTIDQDNFGFAAKTVQKAIEISQYRHVAYDVGGDPTTLLVYPVFDNFEPNRTIAGALGIRIFWTILLGDLLPDDANGFIVVVDNNCHQTFTYRIDGPNATYLGVGDRHDPAFGDRLKMGNISHDLVSRASPVTRSYSRVELNSDYCGFSVRLYPSQDTLDGFLDSKPMVQTAVVALCFFVASLLFLAYDFLVGRRQRIVLSKALASGAIVNSLFPERVIERLYGQQSSASESTARSECVEFDSAISELYPETTVFFADICGFTEWSRNKSPHQVFVLLGKLFGCFDAAARTYGVYKIETVG